MRSADVDVLVDYTSPSAVMNNVWTAVQARVHLVVGLERAYRD
jgi:dihydrodipicolinate reductase